MPRPLLFALAVLFAISITAYTFVWMYYMHAAPEVESIGLTLREDPAGSRAIAIRVEAGSAAEAAGIHARDVVQAVNGHPLRSLDPFYDAAVRGKPGEQVTLDWLSADNEARTVRIELQPARPNLETRRLPGRIAQLLADSYPLWFLIVGLVVLFYRLEDGYAWLLAVLFACFIAGPEYQEIIPRLPPEFRRSVFAYALLFAFLGPPIFYVFFTKFPTASPLERRAPWLKWAALGFGAMITLPSVFSALVQGSHFPFYVGAGWMTTAQWASLHRLNLFGWVALGFAALLANTFAARDAYARRRIRVILWGTLAGFGPMITLFFLWNLTRQPFFQGQAARILGNALLILVPVSMAYSVVQYRVLEIPILLKRSARYVLVRRLFDFALFGALALAVVFLQQFAGAALHGWQGQQISAWPPDANDALTFIFIIGLVSGAALARARRHVRERYTRSLDRRFFRSAYDARQVLEDLAEKVRGVSSREQLGTLLRQQIRQALHPKSMAVYFEAGAGILRSQDAAEKWPESLATDAPLLKELTAHGRPWEVPAGDEWAPSGPYAVNLPQLANLRTLLDEEMGRTSPAASTDVIAALAPAEPECLVPLVGHDSQLVGLVVLGQRLSEEPYSDEDERLLASVAAQAAVALENMRLAESMAEKLETERKNASEIAIAREVQSKLFPQTHPPMATLEYAGLCDQARKVGGDYYDCLDLGAGQLALALADISGKGIYAALLMANLQANLRSQYARALDDLGGLMRSVNHLFQQSTGIGLYATMFFAVYSDATRKLRYVNCGHNPPLLVRADGTHLRLESTAMVIGLFEQWDCEVAEADMRPGDLLVIYSDGVTEAQSDAGEFYGEERLLQASRAAMQTPIAEAARSIAQAVHTFSETDQEDDLTLLVARAR